MSIEQDMNDILGKNEITNRHSFFQLKYFVINKEPTHQSKLWRCVREIETRKTAIDSINLELEETQDNLQLLDLEINKQKDIYTDVESLEIHKRKLNRKKSSILKNVDLLNKKIKECEEEAKFLVEAYKELSKIEQIKPFDDLESQKQHWNAKILQEFQLRGLLGLGIDLELAKTTLCLNDEMEVKQQFAKQLEKTKQHLIKQAETLLENKNG